jgi:hypothetical protein
MKKATSQPEEGKPVDKVFIDYVSKDKDWCGVIDNELRCQEGWQRVWGFLADNQGIFEISRFRVRETINKRRKNFGY